MPPTSLPEARSFLRVDEQLPKIIVSDRPGPGGSPHYEMSLRVEVPDTVDPRALRDALEREADRLVIDVAMMPA